MNLKCIACDNTDLQTLINYPSRNKEKYNIIKCTKCKLTWCNPMPSEEEINLHYNYYYNSYYNNRNQNIINRKLNYLKDLISLKKFRETKFIKNSFKYVNVKNFLDYGCGKGELLKIGKELNLDCMGTEFSEELQEIYNNDNLKIIKAKSFSDLNRDLKFDVIFFKHLIEHIPDLVNFLHSAKECLSENGIIAVKTPSNTSLRAKTNTSKWHLVNPPEHMWSFNKNNFSKILKKCGYKILKIQNSLIVNELICYAKKI